MEEYTYNDAYKNLKAQFINRKIKYKNYVEGPGHQRSEQDFWFYSPGKLFKSPFVDVLQRWASVTKDSRALIATCTGEADRNDACSLQEL